MKVERLVGGSREGAAAGGETPTKGPDPQGPALAWPWAAATAPRQLPSAGLCRHHRPDKGLVPSMSPSVTSLPPRPLSRDRVRTSGCKQHHSFCQQGMGCSGCLPILFLLERLCRALAGETEAGAGILGQGMATGWNKTLGVNIQDEGVGNLSALGVPLRGGAHTVSPSPEAWQVLPGTRLCLRPALPRGELTAECVFYSNA